MLVAAPKLWPDSVTPLDALGLGAVSLLAGFSDSFPVRLLQGVAVFGAGAVILGGTILIAICFTSVMLIVDLIYAWIDPRIRAKYSRTKG